MDKYYNNTEYREKVEAAWDKHKYLYDKEYEEFNPDGIDRRR